MSLKRIAIFGPGLLGGSIALALRKRADLSVALWARRPDAVEELNAIAIADFTSTDAARVARNADVIVLCTPVGAMGALARTIAPAVKAEALITDVGSVKTAVVTELSEIFRGHGRFVGSHPMAGSEQTGIRAARAELFKGSVCIVTPDEQTPKGAAAEVGEFWRSLGCEVREVSPVEHDEIVSLVSHLPHLLAATLVNTVAGRNETALNFCGPGFRDTTRVASGQPAMWAEILTSNRGAVVRSAEAMIEMLREIANILARDADPLAIEDFLTQAKQRRDQLRLPPLPNA